MEFVVLKDIINYPEVVLYSKTQLRKPYTIGMEISKNTKFLHHDCNNTAVKLCVAIIYKNFAPVPVNLSSSLEIFTISDTNHGSCYKKV